MKFIMKTTKLGGNWTQIETKRHIAQIKHFVTPSNFGINGGRISKLWIQDKRNPKPNGIISYDREWVKKPTKKTSREANRLYNYLLKKYN